MSSAIDIHQQDHSNSFPVIASASWTTTEKTLSWAQFATLSDSGNVRECNEDRIWVEAWPDHSAILAVVADGVGGNRGGAEAAETAVTTFRTLLDQPLPTAAHDRYTQLLQKFYEADQQIRDYTLDHFHLRGMGTTVVAAIITPQNCIHLYAGDSRLYHWRNRSLNYQTVDHSLVRRLVEMGTISEGEAYNHPLRFAINSCLGGWGTEHLVIDPKWDDSAWNHSPQCQNPETPSLLSPIFSWQCGDLLLLSTDGLHDLISNADIASALQSFPAGQLIPTQVVTHLAQLALEQGGFDNISLAAITLSTSS